MLTKNDWDPYTNNSISKVRLRIPPYVLNSAIGDVYHLHCPNWILYKYGLLKEQVEFDYHLCSKILGKY